jgi:hypothetical protein
MSRKSIRAQVSALIFAALLLGPAIGHAGRRDVFGPDFLHPEFKRFIYGYHADPAAVQRVGE